MTYVGLSASWGINSATRHPISVTRAQDKNEDGQYHPDADHTHWDIRKSIPGEPGQDYPVLGAIPETSFSCDGRADGERLESLLAVSTLPRQLSG